MPSKNSFQPIATTVSNRLSNSLEKITLGSIVCQFKRNFDGVWQK